VISGTEYVVIAFVLFLVFGPERLPEVARKLGGWMRDMRRAASDIRLVLEAEAGELTEPLREVSREARRLREEGKAAFDWKGPVHPEGPGPADSLEDLADIEGDAESLDDAETGAGQGNAETGAGQDDAAPEDEGDEARGEG